MNAPDDKTFGVTTSGGRPAVPSRISNGIRSRGFTLIEILVVIVIVSLLAALMFPAFARAREKAQAAKCVSNLRQLSLAWLSYAGDNDGRLVAGKLSPEQSLETGLPADAEVLWPTLLRDYLGDPLLRSTTYQITWGGPLMCPTLQRKMKRSSPWSDEWSCASVSYGINVWATMNYVPWGFYGWDRLVSIPRPAETIVFVDSANTSNPNVVQGWYLAGPSWGQQDVDCRHSGGANAAFADGHVAWMPESMLIDDSFNYNYEGNTPWQPK